MQVSNPYFLTMGLISSVFFIVKTTLSISQTQNPYSLDNTSSSQVIRQALNTDFNPLYSPSFYLFTKTSQVTTLILTLVLSHINESHIKVKDHNKFISRQICQTPHTTYPLSL